MASGLAFLGYGEYRSPRSCGFFFEGKSPPRSNLFLLFYPDGAGEEGVSKPSTYLVNLSYLAIDKVVVGVRFPCLPIEYYESNFFETRELGLENYKNR